MPSFKTIDFRELNMEVNWAEEHSKYMFIADMHGQANTYFSYNAQFFEFHGEVKKAIIAKKQSKQDAAEELRRQIISAMRCGRHLVIHLSTMVPTFSDYDIKNVCPLKDHFFHRENVGEKVREWIRPEEDHDIHKN